VIAITFVFVLFGKIYNKSDVIFAVLITLAGLLEEIIGYIEYKKQR